MTKQKKQANSLEADLFFRSGDKTSVSEAQVRLLGAIADEGSISAAAKAVGISYKTAWDRIDSMNNLSDRPLVLRSSGGRHGGGTRLTAAGQQLVAGFKSLQQQHQNYLSGIDAKLTKVSDVARFVSSGHLNTSARNQYRGVILKLSRGGVNTEVEIRIGDALSLYALVTNESRKDMALKKGVELIALVKASWVLLSNDASIVTSARNKLEGVVSKIHRGEVNSEVILDIADGKTVCAIITNPSVRELKLRKGTTACALFKASSVILMRA